MVCSANITLEWALPDRVVRLHPGLHTPPTTWARVPPIPRPQLSSASPSGTQGVMKPIPHPQGFQQLGRLRWAVGGRGRLPELWLHARYVEKLGLGVGGKVGHGEAVLRRVCLSPAHDQVPVHPVHARQEDVQGEGGRGQDVRQLDAAAVRGPWTAASCCDAVFFPHIK